MLYTRKRLNKIVRVRKCRECGVRAYTVETVQTYFRLKDTVQK